MPLHPSKKVPAPGNTNIHPNQPSREEALDAVRTLLRWIGENPQREGLIDTPKRVVDSYEEFFSGYKADPRQELLKTFEDIQDYDDIVLVRGIDFVSHCEHHIVPVTGIVHVAYWPDQKIVGISKLARVVDILAKRLTSQENMTKEIANIISETLQPKGVGVVVSADHQCMSTRGINKKNAGTVTSFFTGNFNEEKVQERFLKMIAL